MFKYRVRVHGMHGCARNTVCVFPLTTEAPAVALGHSVAGHQLQQLLVQLYFALLTMIYVDKPISQVIHVDNPISKVFVTILTVSFQLNKIGVPQHSFPYGGGSKKAFLIGVPQHSFPYGGGSNKAFLKMYCTLGSL